MRTCMKCSAMFEEGSRFCPECGTVAESLSPKIVPQEDFVGRVERNVYFKIARGFAWLILLFATIGLLVSVFSLAPSATDLWLGGDTRVTSDDLRRTMASQQRGARATEETERIDPARLASLDRAIYEFIDLLPKEQPRRDFFGRVTTVKIDIEELRRLIKSRVSNVHNVDEQIAALKEIKDVIVAFPQADRLTIMDKYFEVKVAKQRAVQARKAEAVTKLSSGSVAILSSISIITLGSMVLVLLAVERNTRKV